jgi:hypothetical protein
MASLSDVLTELAHTQKEQHRKHRNFTEDAEKAFSFLGIFLRLLRSFCAFCVPDIR